MSRGSRGDGQIPGSRGCADNQVLKSVNAHATWTPVDPSSWLMPTGESLAVRDGEVRPAERAVRAKESGGYRGHNSAVGRNNMKLGSSKTTAAEHNLISHQRYCKQYFTFANYSSDSETETDERQSCYNVRKLSSRMRWEGCDSSKENCDLSDRGQGPPERDRETVVQW